MFERFYGKTSLRKKNLGTEFIYRKEIIGVLLVACFVFLTVSFISYNPLDNSWFYFQSNVTIVSNWCGAIGANIAALSFFLFGSASYVLLLCLLLLSIFMFIGKTFKSEWERFLALSILLFSSAILLHLHGFDPMNVVPGGFVGFHLGSFLRMLTGTIGGIIAQYALLLVSVLLLLQISFVSFGKFVGKWSFAFGVVCVQYSFILAKIFLKYAWLAIYYIWKFVVWALSSNEKPEDDDGEELDELTNLAKQAREQQDELVKHGEPVGSAKSTKFAPTEWLNDLEEVDEDDPGEILLHCITPRQFGEFITLSSGAKLYRMRNCVVQEIPEYKETVIEYRVPTFSQFQEERYVSQSKDEIESECQERARKLEEKLEHFGVRGKVSAVRPGPVITLFEYRPAIDTKISKIMALEDDLALALRALSIRIIAPIPGRSVVGFEISNHVRHDVFLSEVLSNNEQAKKMRLPLALGVDITGNPVFEDLVSMPHLLVAGSTGSGKSVGLNAMLVSLLCRFTPKDLRLILIDPKRLEFAPYADIPHLLLPIVTNPRQAIPVLKWVVQEMEDRYDLMARVGARSIDDYRRIRAKQKGEELPVMPFILLMIDELADLMMVAGKDVETQIARIAQMARAAGIHMIVATQRPSVDVVTGLIKVNFPARVAFRVSSKIDSRTIIDDSGAEKLLGRGDMLFANAASAAAQRIHGGYVSTSEVERLASYLKQEQTVEYVNLHEALRSNRMQPENDFEDDLYDQVRDYVKTIDSISISLLQRKYRIGFNRSARMIEQLEMDGLVAPAQGGKVRKVLR